MLVYSGGLWEKTQEKIAVRCSNCGKETMIDVDILDTTYQDIITTFVFNTMLKHVGMLWIIETHEQLKYYLDKHNSEWMIGGPWYITSIYKKLHVNVFVGFIWNSKTDRYNIMCSIDAHKNSINHLVMMAAAVGVVHFHQIQQQKHYISSVQP